MCAFSERLAIHCAPDSALRCFGGHSEHIEPRRAASSRGDGFSPALAGSEAAFSRSNRGAVCGYGAGLAQFRRSRVDTRRGALADRAGGLRCRTVWFLFGDAISSRTQSALTVCRKRNHLQKKQKNAGQPFTPLPPPPSPSPSTQIHLPPLQSRSTT